MYRSNYFKGIMLLTALVASSYLVVAFMLTRRSEPERMEETLIGSKGATSVIKNFRHIESQLDRIGWELSADKAELLENKAKLYGIIMRFYTSEKEVIALRGDEGTLDLSNKNIVVKGNVAADYNDTYHMTAAEMTWDSASRLLSSVGEIRIFGPEGEIKGNAFVARPGRKRFIIKDGVTVDFKGGPGRTLFGITGEPS
jgi:LPS export ABC transporter protein LptC